MLGLYIHIPFCKSKCKYCGFLSISNFDSDVVKNYLHAIEKELSVYTEYQFDTIYMGGGTPSVLDYYELENLLKTIKKLNLKKLKEFTFEANPESLDETKIKILKDYGVSRISIGVQSLDNNVLQFLGRIHKAKDVYDCMYLLKKYDFNINVDIIFDIPTVPAKTIYETLSKLFDLAPNHISAYSYSFDTDFLNEYKIEKNTHILEISKSLENNGYIRYEISNFAKKGYESLHNINYWKMGDFMGVGAAAHSMINLENSRVRFSHPKNIKDYVDSCFFYDNIEIVRDKREIIMENIIFGLRLTEGVDLELFNRLEIKNMLEELINRGYLKIVGDKVCLTEKGLLFLDYVQEYFYLHF
ncbi:radical SAM family heme chaperone HemW [Deferribacter thermophilus]|uniref:radical SAM family heme chaperone HemW n=1 Tax=Deferribacter thermophilus TaxID=53573 RepID=UPI003C136CDC